MKAIYAAVREEEAAELTKKLEKEPKLPKRRWAYALKDTSSKDSAMVRTNRASAIWDGTEERKKGISSNRVE